MFDEKSSSSVIDVSYETLSGKPYTDFSKMTWIINTTDSKGVMYDETEQISSIYILDNVTTDYIIDRNNKSRLMIYGKMKSNAGNWYTFTINDAQGIISMEGPAMRSSVIRKFYNVNVLKTTVKDFNNK